MLATSVGQEMKVNKAAKVGTGTGKIISPQPSTSYSKSTRLVPFIPQLNFNFADLSSVANVSGKEDVSKEHVKLIVHHIVETLQECLKLPGETFWKVILEGVDADSSENRDTKTSQARGRITFAQFLQSYALHRSRSFELVGLALDTTSSASKTEEIPKALSNVVEEIDRLVSLCTIKAFASHQTIMSQTMQLQIQKVFPVAFLADLCAILVSSGNLKWAQIVMHGVLGSSAQRTSLWNESALNEHLSHLAKVAKQVVLDIKVATTYTSREGVGVVTAPGTLSPTDLCQFAGDVACTLCCLLYALPAAALISSNILHQSVGQVQVGAIGELILDCARTLYDDVAPQLTSWLRQQSQASDLSDPRTRNSAQVLATYVVSIRRYSLLLSRLLLRRSFQLTRSSSAATRPGTETDCPPAQQQKLLRDCQQSWQDIIIRWRGSQQQIATSQNAMRYADALESQLRCHQSKISGPSDLGNAALGKHGNLSSDQEADSVLSAEVIMQRRQCIQAVQAMLPHLNEGYIYACLGTFQWDVAHTVDALLTENLPPALAELASNRAALLQLDKAILEQQHHYLSQQKEQEEQAEAKRIAVARAREEAQQRERDYYLLTQLGGIDVDNDRIGADNGNKKDELSVEVGTGLAALHLHAWDSNSTSLADGEFTNSLVCDDLYEDDYDDQYDDIVSSLLLSDDEGVIADGRSVGRTAQGLSVGSENARKAQNSREWQTSGSSINWSAGIASKAPAPFVSGISLPAPKPAVPAMQPQAHRPDKTTKPKAALPPATHKLSTEPEADRNAVVSDNPKSKPRKAKQPTASSDTPATTSAHGTSDFVLDLTNSSDANQQFEDIRRLNVLLREREVEQKFWEDLKNTNRDTAAGRMGDSERVTFKARGGKLMYMDKSEADAFIQRQEGGDAESEHSSSAVKGDGTKNATVDRKPAKNATSAKHSDSEKNKPPGGAGRGAGPGRGRGKAGYDAHHQKDRALRKMGGM